MWENCLLLCQKKVLISTPIFFSVCKSLLTGCPTPASMDIIQGFLQLLPIFKRANWAPRSGGKVRGSSLAWPPGGINIMEMDCESLGVIPKWGSCVAVQSTPCQKIWKIEYSLSAIWLNNGSKTSGNWLVKKNPILALLDIKTENFSFDSIVSKKH